jgi:hypothetical protein
MPSGSKFEPLFMLQTRQTFLPRNPECLEVVSNPPVSGLSEVGTQKTEVKDPGYRFQDIMRFCGLMATKYLE